MMNFPPVSANPRPMILAVVSSMLFLSLLYSLTVQYGHADTPIAVTAEEIQPLVAGRPAPYFVVRTLDGGTFEFDPRNLERPAILIAFRGGWCPYCNMHLSELRHVIPEIGALGVDVLFLSGDRPAALHEGLQTNTKEEIDGFEYRILSDADANAAIALGIAFKVADSYVDRLTAAGKDIDDSSITRRGVLPVPAVFAIGDDGVIAFAHTNSDYKIRLPEKELLAVAKDLVAN